MDIENAKKLIVELCLAEMELTKAQGEGKGRQNRERKAIRSVFVALLGYRNAPKQFVEDQVDAVIKELS